MRIVNCNGDESSLLLVFRLWRGWFAAIVAVVFTACASAPSSPLAIFADRDAEPSRRLRALQQMTLDDRGVVAMYSIVWDDRQPIDLRLAAMDRLIDHDTAGFRHAATTRLPRIDRWEMLIPLCERIAAGGWSDLTPALIQSWAKESRQYDDASRPERTAITTLNPSVAVDHVLWHTLATESVTSGAAAWTILYRITDRDALASGLMQQTADTPLLLDLHAGWRGLRLLPRNREQVLWLMSICRSYEWQSALDYARAAGFERCELRHVAMMSMAASLRVNGEFLTPPPRQEMAAAIAEHIAIAGPGYSRQGGELTTMRPIDESLQTHLPNLSDADLLAIGFVADHVSASEVRSQLFSQADADLADSTSEHGGLLVSNLGHIRANAYKPAMTGNDQAFYAPPEMITAMYTALAHYHFHAITHDNRAFAGPGGGDLAFADRFGAACLVFTFIDRDTLNVDYYHEGGVVIDLGCITRPQ